MRIQGILFDLDGVIIDSHEAIVMAARNTIKSICLTYREEIEEKLFNIAHRRVFIEVYPECEHLVDTFDKLYVNNPLHYKVSLLPHVMDILCFCAVQNIKTAIVTTKDRYRTERILKNLNLKFDAIVTCEDTEKTRPDPAPINLAIEKLNLSENDMVYIGDTPLDVVQAKKAGVISVAITTGIYKSHELKIENPDFVIDDINQLVEVLKKYEK